MVISNEDAGHLRTIPPPIQSLLSPSVSQVPFDIGKNPERSFGGVAEPPSVTVALPIALARTCRHPHRNDSVSDPGPADTPQQMRKIAARPPARRVRTRSAKDRARRVGGGGSFACAVPNTQLTTPSVICFRGPPEGALAQQQGFTPIMVWVYPNSPFDQPRRKL